MKSNRTILSLLLAFCILVSSPVFALAEAPGTDDMSAENIQIEIAAVKNDSNSQGGDNAQGSKPKGDGNDQGEDEGNKPKPEPPPPEVTEPEAEHEKGAFALSAKKQRLALGESFLVEAVFAEAVSSNAATLTLTYDPEQLDYGRFLPTPGVQLLGEKAEGGEIRLTLAAPDYNLRSFGSYSLRVNSDPNLAGKAGLLRGEAEYVVRREDGKALGYASASLEYEIGLWGDVDGDGKVDILDLSALIDVSGMGSGDEGWPGYSSFDFNRNGLIDIHDLSFLAQLILESREIKQ